mgnify:FL=1
MLVALLQEASVCTFKQKEVVLEPGENDDRKFMVVDGIVTLPTYKENGRQIITDHLGRAIKVLAHHGVIEVNGRNILVRGTP